MSRFREASAMNFRILAASVRPHGRVFALLAATALVASLAAPDVQAQQPAPAPAAAPNAKKAAPKPAPVAPPSAAQATPPAAAPPAAGAPPPEQQVQLIYSQWTKFCPQGQDGRIESGQPVIAAVIIEPEGEAKKILRVTLPLGMQLVHGTRVIVDSNPPLQIPYVICPQNGCMSVYEATSELLANLKTGQNLVVQAINSNGAPLTLPLPLTEAGGASFAKAYDGPATDPKVFEENQKKLQDELQKRAEEARKKLEANPPAAGAAPANPAAK